ncbi:hypothetical protein Arnit_0063 [Arcobacter nitrofigilis DSM 7299]|uniref:Uncharacterized protein n=1 Tax=Arcobacter nitrofigilis (strain ATCC 33309 / DSM 7299 / CCUG 15893 / LMG 7604 / NCTC 12251 / CI) TaxID=572480 RepID=D5V3M2_ARCNC|nr:hypothetical protein [Arcobacter nitrofigilis]ADG91733.1 hypothetical protein Arnit_0063 [Arcobacter nitrofigilis DSM 7299]
MSKETYVELYKKYDLYRSDIYMLCEERPAEILFLFEEVCDELIKPLGINTQLPKEFIQSAKSFSAQNTFTNIYFAELSNRAFFLSDLIDFLALIKSKKTT